MRQPIEIEDLENAMDALRQAREPMVKFSLDPDEMKTRAIVLMQAGIDQALLCLTRICKEANRHE